MLEADPQVLSWVTPYFFPLQVLNFQDFLNFVLTLFLPFSTELQEQEMGHQEWDLGFITSHLPQHHIKQKVFSNYQMHFYDIGPSSVEMRAHGSVHKQKADCALQKIRTAAGNSSRGPQIRSHPVDQRSVSLFSDLANPTIP